MSKVLIENKNEDTYDISKINSLITDGYEKIINDYTQIEKSFNNILKTMPLKYKDSFINLFNQIEIMKKHFKSYINSINVAFNSLNSNSNTEISDLNLSFSKTIKNSYEQISNEFNKIETITKEILENNEKIKEKRKKRVKLLEKKLQSYIEEINNFDFSIINNIYNINIKNNEKISNYILKNQKIEQYKLIDDNDTFLDNNKISSKINNKNYSTESESHHNNNDNLLINELVKMNMDKEEDVIEFIQTFQQKKSEKETDTIKRNY